MAKINLAAERNQVRASSIQENRAILREIQAKKEVDARKQDELGTLFDIINAECCASKSLREESTISTPRSFDKIQNTCKPVRYGPLPGCVPGKWWANRMDCSRDCVHEQVDQNIQHGPYGAVSVCTPKLNVHNDVDLGHVLTFTSREYSPANKCTDPLVLNYKNQVPIRLVRSCCLANKYSPRTGYRYDGLYTIIRHWIGVSAAAAAADTTRYHKFVLTRVLDQEPPPWVDNKVHFETPRLKKSTTSHSDACDQESKAIKFVYNKIDTKSKPSNVIAIVSRQVYDKCTSNSPDGTSKLTLNADSANQSSANLCSTKLCSTNLSIRTNLYDSSHQDVKKALTSVCKIFKPNQFGGSSSKYHVASQTPTNTRSAAASAASDSGLIRMEKTVPTAGNGYQPKPRKRGCVLKYNNDYSSPTSKMAKHKKTSQAHSKINLSQNTRANFSAVHELLHETEKSSESTSIDSLAPDELVSVIVKEKYHPMAKLLIGNMIGLENQEAAIVNAYNALTKVDQDDSKQPKENKLRNKFSIKSPSSKKNGISHKKQRREIANLTIDAKFDAPSSRSRGLGGTSNKRILKAESTRRKLLNTRRAIQSRNRGIASSRDSNSKMLEKGKNVQSTVNKVQKTVTVWTQCSLLTGAAVPTVDQCQQTEDWHVETDCPGMKMEQVQLIDLGDVKSELSSNGGSAFAAVSADSYDRIARLRSIGFRPIRCDSPPTTQDVESGDQFSKQQDVDQEYNKYTSEENDVVGYMDEQLHFQDIEEQEKMSIEGDGSSLQAAHSTNILPQPIETLTEHDFNKPWHGWRKISINGQTYWTGC